MSSTDSLETVGDILLPEGVGDVFDAERPADRPIFDLTAFGTPSPEIDDDELPGVPPGNDENAVG